MLVVGLIITREKEVFLYALISVDRTIMRQVMTLNFQELVFNLQKYWSDYGRKIQQPYYIEKATTNKKPATFLS